MRQLVWILIGCGPLLITRAEAGGMAVRMGPPGIGSGGPNPVSLPPGPADLGLSYVTDKGTEFNLSVTALSVARRTSIKAGPYMSLGGGLALSANGVGFGPYAAFGYEAHCSWIGCFSAEYNQAIGLGLGNFISPYGFRLGIIKWF